MERRDVPPRWEGLDAGEELRTYQEPEWCGETRQDEVVRAKIATGVLHQRTPLGRHSERIRMHEEHRAHETALS